MRFLTTPLVLLAACTGEPENVPADCDSPQVFYGDADGDGFGDINAAIAACAAPAGAVQDKTDCDDTDPQVHPDAAEACDGVDQDWDGDIDEDAADALQVFADVDGDGFGDAGQSMMACEAGDGWVLDSSDCDDANDAVNPDGLDVCDELDGDCDGEIPACQAGGVYTDEEVDAVWSGDGRHDGTGRALAVVGDLDGDGLADAVIGAPGHDLSWQAEEGIAFIHYSGGAADAALTDSARLGGSAQQDRLGAAVAAAGDVDDDGLADLLVSAPGAEADAATDAGAVYLFLGDASRLTGSMGAADAAHTVFSLGVPWAEVGTALAPAGDTNDDGYADFLIGAAQLDGDGDARGAAWLLQSDGLGWDPLEDLAEQPLWTGIADEDHVGAPGSLSSGDFDGDGFSDIAIGARDADLTPGDDRAGAVYVVHGRAGLFPATNTLQDADSTMFGVVVDDQVNFGAAVAGVGDMDGDGFEDLLVGGPNHDVGQDPGESEVGAVWLFRGSAAGITATDASTADLVVEGDESWSSFGESIAAVGDVTDDGVPDAAVGAFARDGAAPEYGHTNGGAVYLLPGGLSGGAYVASDLPLRIEGTQQDGHLGAGIAGGDLDGDGLSDLLIGAPGSHELGAALVFLGRGI